VNAEVAENGRGGRREKLLTARVLTRATKSARETIHRSGLRGAQVSVQRTDANLGHPHLKLVNAEVAENGRGGRGEKLLTAKVLRTAAEDAEKSF